MSDSGRTGLQEGGEDVRGELCREVGGKDDWHERETQEKERVSLHYG